MGGGQSSKSVFDFKYQKERSELRRALILSFLGNPENQELVDKIAKLRSLIVLYPDICATAAAEAKSKFDCSATNIESAYFELERLYSIYETSTILKSAQCRVGAVACPLGHYAAFFESAKVHPSGKSKIVCNLCEKTCINGYVCAYCDYNLCIPCSTVYCSFGHAMKLWTHPESQHSCVICNTHPITSGYRCTICDDYDICDLCTYKDGRKAVQLQILERCADDLSYIDKHQDESETALKTISNHRKKMANQAYSSTLELFQFSVSLHDVKIIVVAEVRQTRITKEVRRLRSILSEGKEFSVTARTEAARDGHFTAEEVARLTMLLDESTRERSAQVRSNNVIACPLGHAAIHYIGKPLLYMRRESIVSFKGTSSSVPICRVCDRVAAPEGFHCAFCEYDLCTSCAVIFCSEGHPMTMWTEPESIAGCSRCNAQPITSGYYCSQCNVSTCDLCTTKEARGTLRNVWDIEMNDLISFMKANKKLSDIALYYQWRHTNFVVSTGLLVDYVKELRMAKYRAEKQIDQKDIIDQIKILRLEVTKNPELSMPAVREALKSNNYIFSSRKKAQAEASRLSKILKARWQAQTAAARKMAGIACPLGHACVLYSSTVNHRRITASSANDDNGTQNTKSNLAVLPSAAESSLVLVTIAPPVDVPAITAEDANYDAADDPDEALPVCKICGVADLEGGKYCPLCEYHLCSECTVIYCRMGHPCIIWTFPDANCLTCDMCKTSQITSGYHCMTCESDCCDLCTTKDCRNAFMLWPRREVKRLVLYLETIRDDTVIAREYLNAQVPDLADSLHSMAKLCNKLRELEEIKVRCDEDIKLKRAQHKIKMYARDGL
jgi:hypothetical protein